MGTFLRHSVEIHVRSLYDIVYTPDKTALKTFRIIKTQYKRVCVRLSVHVVINFAFIFRPRKISVCSCTIRLDAIPLQLRDSELTLLEFRRLLKTHLFS